MLTASDRREIEQLLTTALVSADGGSEVSASQLADYTSCVADIVSWLPPKPVIETMLGTEQLTGLCLQDSPESLKVHSHICSLILVHQSSSIPFELPKPRFENFLFSSSGDEFPEFTDLCTVQSYLFH